MSQYLDVTRWRKRDKINAIGPKVHAFCTKVRGLKLHADTFLKRQINGRVLSCDESNLGTAMKNESLTILDCQTIMEFIDKIKKEPMISPSSEIEYAPIRAIYDTWNELCKINETRFKLLPQHIRDYTKPPPTYLPPPQHLTGSRGGPTHSGGQGQQSMEWVDNLIWDEERKIDQEHHHYMRLNLLLNGIQKIVLIGWDKYEILKLIYV